MPTFFLQSTFMLSRMVKSNKLTHETSHLHSAYPEINHPLKLSPDVQGD